MAVKVLGVCGSPIAGGNTEVLLSRALDAARSAQGVHAEMVTLAGKAIGGCRHCNWCMARQSESQCCALRDDMEPLYPKVLEADGLILASPVYIGRLSGHLALFMDRLRAFIHGKQFRGALADKVGGALAVGWFRHAGLETALQSMVVGFLTYQMIPVGGMLCPWGAPAVASQGGAGGFDKTRRHGVLEDALGIQAAEGLARRVVALARRLKGEVGERGAGGGGQGAMGNRGCAIGIGQQAAGE
jgi:multimeric flavodoxin WrbA